MGRYSIQLAPLFADFVGVRAGMTGARVLDVGCGTGALSAELARRVGAAQVAGVEPAPSFVEACRARVPEAEIVHGPAEHLPWGDATFDAALSQLVLSFVADADQVARELRRVVRAEGRVGACMWHEGASLQLTDLFWQAAATIDPAVRQHESKMAYRKQGEIAALWNRAGLREIEETFLDVRANYQDFDDFWEPICTSAGPIAVYMAAANDEKRSALREACRKLLGDPRRPFELSARACAARARV